MSSYLSNLLTTTTSKYTSLRRALLPDENDGDTEDDSHITRVLRAYYVEKQRPFPPWLPPDPRSPYSQPQPQLPQNNYGNLQRPGMPGAAGSAGRRGGALSDLWDSPSDRQPKAQPSSLRSSGRAPVASAGRGERFNASGGASSRLQPVGGRPLPSQREGSYQRAAASEQSDEAPPRPSMSSTASGASSTQDRLKARLWGGGVSGRSSPAGGLAERRSGS